MTKVLLSEAKGKRLALKYGVDPDAVRGVWHRGDRRHLIFEMCDGTERHVETSKKVKS